MIPPDEALALLREGNLRFRAGDRDPGTGAGHRSTHVTAPRPVAILLTCADSRVQPEALFQQSSGRLFVTQVAGGVAGSSQIGTIEFGVEVFGVRLIVVLGHSLCGAVAAALDPDRTGSVHLQPVLDRIRAGLPPEEPLDLDAAIRANTRAACAALERDSELLREAIASGRVRVVRAHYCLETGVVEFFDDASGGALT